MSLYRYKPSFLLISLLFISPGCQNPAVTDVMNQVQAAQPSQIIPKRSSNTQQPVQSTSDAPAQQFIDIHDLGKKITLHTDFGELLGHLPKGKDKSRVYLARIDDFPLGSGYMGLDKWDMALETGFIDGLLDK